MNWDEVASRIPSRNAKMCHSRYKRIKTCPGIRWKQTENAKLKRLIGQYGEDWSRIATHFARKERVI